MMNDIRLTAYDEWRSRVYSVPVGSCYPQNRLFRVGKTVDYKRRKVGCFRGNLFRPGERLAARHRRPAREKPAESPFPLRTESPRSRIRSPAIAHYELRILVNNRSLVGGGYHCGISLEIARDAVFLLNRHLFFTLFDFLVGNLQLNLIFGNVD